MKICKLLHLNETNNKDLLLPHHIECNLLPHFIENDYFIHNLLASGRICGDYPGFSSRLQHVFVVVFWSRPSSHWPTLCLSTFYTASSALRPVRCDRKRCPCRRPCEWLGSWSGTQRTLIRTWRSLWRSPTWSEFWWGRAIPCWKRDSSQMYPPQMCSRDISRLLLRASFALTQTLVPDM